MAEKLKRMDGRLFQPDFVQFSRAYRLTYMRKLLKMATKSGWAGA
jgi:hypothetical protein